MRLEFRKIPNQESQPSQHLNTTLAMQGPEQNPSRPRLLYCNPSTLRELPSQRHSSSSVKT
jgi:hypothetical protein